MIWIGLSASEKEDAIRNYLAEHGLSKAKIFYFKKFRPAFALAGEVEYIEYSDIIMYKFFYRLLEEIHEDTLVVIDECMRTQNRSDLTYNCAHHYLNQTPHRIIFEHFPFIENEVDFMILLDFQSKGRYKGKGFDATFLAAEDVQVKFNPIRFDVEVIPVTKQQRQAYEQKREALFQALGNKDPDTIPRNLHVFAGSFKKPHLNGDRAYVARNGRLGLPNVATYRDMKPTVSASGTAQLPLGVAAAPDVTIIDFPHRQIDLNDYLKTVKSRSVAFVSTGLPIDVYYQERFQGWLRRVGEFAAKASLRR